MRVAVYNQHWAVLGGGEQVAAAIAEHLSATANVTLLGLEPVDIEAIRSRLGPDLGGCHFRVVDGDHEAGESSADFDVFVNSSYSSHAANRAKRGIYYVHFPEQPPVRRRLLGTACRVAGSGLDLLPFDGRAVERARSECARHRVERRWIDSYTNVLGNSAYTVEWIAKRWGARADILPPPVRPPAAPGDKQPVIASVGRFFDPRRGHSKKQLDLVKAFRSLHESGRAPGWSLTLLGGAIDSGREYALSVKREARGLPVDIHFNAPRAVLADRLATASLYWHGAGYGEDAARRPEHFEHFGISVVEAMAAGTVPIVFGGGGPAEIVRHGVDGLHWRTLQQLVQETMQLASSPGLVQELSANAQQRAREFDVSHFERRLSALIPAPSA